MKALDEWYFLMVVFTLLLNRVHVFTMQFYFRQSNMTMKGLIVHVQCIQRALLHMDNT